jgi:2-polyprenyl-3-methyl-5-hydroxy-6-metoxy-1,4-benzoquinol methylase
MRFNLRPIDCPTCERDDTRLLGVRGGARQRQGKGIETLIVQCRGCGLIYPNPFPFPDNTAALYSDPNEYFAAHDAAEKVRDGRILITQLAGMAQVREPSLLDVGSGRGELLAAARLEGLTNVQGIELSPAMCDESERLHGIRPETVTLEQLADAAAGTFDVIVMNAVIEHIHNPDSFIAAARRLAHVGTVLYIDTPREPHLLTMIGRLAGKTLNLSPTWEPFHVFGFNPKALEALLGKHAFAIERIKIHDYRAAAPGPAGLIMLAANITPWAANMFAWARAA